MWIYGIAFYQPNRFYRHFCLINYRSLLYFFDWVFSLRNKVTYTDTFLLAEMIKFILLPSGGLVEITISFRHLSLYNLTYIRPWYNSLMAKTRGNLSSRKIWISLFYNSNIFIDLDFSKGYKILWCWIGFA